MTQGRAASAPAASSADGTDGTRRQHALSRHDLRRGHARPAAAVRLDPELRHPRGRLVGLRASAARRLGRAVRHVRHGVRRDLDRSRQRRAVHRLRRDLVGRAGVRRPRAASRCISSAARCCGCWSAARRAFVDSIDAKVLLSLRHHHRLHLGHGLRILARPQRAAGVALAGDLHAVRAWRAVPAAHAARRRCCRGRRPTRCSTACGSRC